MVNTSSMKYNNEFLWLYRKGQSTAARNLVLYYKKTKQKNNTLGITVTKKIGKSIWQKSFFDHVIRNDDDYLKTLRYIHENPIRWYFKYHG